MSEQLQVETVVNFWGKLPLIKRERDTRANMQKLHLKLLPVNSPCMEIRQSWEFSFMSTGCDLNRINESANIVFINELLYQKAERWRDEGERSELDPNVLWNDLPTSHYTILGGRLSTTHLKTIQNICIDSSKWKVTNEIAVSFREVFGFKTHFYR